METLTLILVLIIAILGWVVWKSYQKNETDGKELVAVTRERDEYVEMGKGLAEFNQKVEERKDAAKLKILKMLETSPKVSNREVAEKVGCSSSSAERYLNELEKEGKIKQSGKTGRSVFYSKI